MQSRAGRQILLSTHSPDLLQDDGIGLDEVLLLQPGPEGTTINTAAGFEDITVLLESGASMSEAVIPKTSPIGAQQLVLFGES
jgi:hypothetical protein